MYEAGDATAFSELEALASKNTDDPEIQVELGTAYKAVGGYKQAEKKYLETCSLYSLDSKKSKEGYIKCKNLLALNYLAEGNYEKSISILIEDFNKTQFKEHQDEISKNIANICHKNNDFDKFILFAEIHLDINPKDTDLRFKIAYEYDKKECNALSLLHYQRLLILTNGATALNNLGVSYWKLDMEGKSFESMRKAANAKSTLAMANIADKYVSIGAIEDAKKEINDAHKLAADKIEISSNIGQSIQLIDKKIEKENKLEKEVLENAESERRFRVENALNSMREIAPISFAGQWKTVWGNVAIESSLDKIAIDGFPKVLDYELRGKIQDNVFMKIKGEGTILGATAKLKIIVKEVFKYESDIPNSEYEEFEGEILLTLIDETNIKILRKEGGNTITEIWQKNV